MSGIYRWSEQILFQFQIMQFTQLSGDREGGVWIGTFYGGVNYLPQEIKPFEKYYPTDVTWCT